MMLSLSIRGSSFPETMILSRGSPLTYHDDERHAVFVAEVVNDNDIGVLEYSRLRFAVEALEHIGLSGKAFGQRLDGHLASDSLVLGAIDDTHAAAAKNAGDFVFAYLFGRGCFHSINPTATEAEKTLSKSVCSVCA